jgi:hypothetical protein
MGNAVIELIKSISGIERDVALNKKRLPLNHSVALAVNAVSRGQRRWRCRLGIRSCHGQPSTITQPCHGIPMLELSVDDILQCVVHEGQFCVHAPEAGALE